MHIKNRSNPQNPNLCYIHAPMFHPYILHSYSMHVQAFPMKPPWKRTHKSLQDNLKHVSFGLEIGESEDDIHDEL